MSSSEIIKCRKCWSEPIYFTEARGKNGAKIPFSVITKLPHDCMFSDSWDCGFCGERLYFDNDIRSGSGRRIPLNYLSSDPHVCGGRDKQ